MNHQPDPDERLERLVSRVLRDLPPQRAPASLERRVFDALEQRQHCVGRQQGFSRWPPLTRACFVIVCVAVMASLLAAMTAAGKLAGDLAALLVAVIPTVWLYVSLSLGSLLYAALFGLSAVAYRTLYLQPSNHR